MNQSDNQQTAPETDPMMALHNHVYGPKPF